MSQRDMILVERVTDGERCGECDMRAYDPPYDGETAYCEAFNSPLESGRECFMRCPACLATPFAVVLTAEMVEAVNKTIGTIEHMLKERMVHVEANAFVGLIRSVDALRAAFPQIKGV